VLISTILNTYSQRTVLTLLIQLTIDGEKALSFVLGVLLSLGMIFYVVYTAPGFALFPISLIKQIPTIQISDIDTARQALDQNREAQRRIEVRYQGTGQQMSVKDRKNLEALQREERTLTRRHRLAEESGNRRRWWEKVGSALRPFKVAFGVTLVALGILIVVSMFLTLYDLVGCGLMLGSTRSRIRFVDIGVDISSLIHKCSIR